MKQIFIVFAMVVSGLLTAATPINQVPNYQTAYELNRWMGAVALKHYLGTKLQQAHNTAVGAYDYSVTGGAMGNHWVGITLPGKAIIRRAFFDVVSEPDGGATIEFKAVTNGDLKPATYRSSWTGIVDGVLTGATSGMIKLDSSQSIYATILASSLSSGKIKVYIDYVLSE